VSWYQKGKTNLDFTEARDSEWQWHQLGHMQVCTSIQTDNHASTPPLKFLQAGCPSCRPTNSVKALKAYWIKCEAYKFGFYSVRYSHHRTVSTVTRTASILIHSRSKVLAVNFSRPSGRLWLYAGLTGSKDPRWLRADLVVCVNLSSSSWV